MEIEKTIGTIVPIIAFDLGSDNPGADFTIATVTSDGGWHISLADDIRKMAETVAAMPNPFFNATLAARKMQLAFNARINAQPAKARRAHLHRKQANSDRKYIAGRYSNFQSHNVRSRRRYFSGTRKIKRKKTFSENV